MSNENLKIGLSLPCTELPQLEAMSSIPECFEFAELSGEVVADALLLKKSHALWSEFDLFNFRDLIPSSLTCQLTSENSVIIQEYKKQLRGLLAQAHACNATTAGIDPDWEKLFSDKERLEIFNDVLRSTAGDREFYDITLLIAVRVPGSGQFPVTQSLELLHKLSNYRVELALDIYPHELLTIQTNWDKLLAPFRFDTAAVRFCYPSELGNKLLYKHIEPVVEALKKWQRSIMLYIAPSGKADLNELAITAQAINPKES